MDSFNLLNLRLHARLDYVGVENPPFSGLGPSLPAFGEGGEEVFLFEAEELVVFDPDDGPRVVVNLPPPRFHGLLAGSAGTGTAGTGNAGAGTAGAGAGGCEWSLAGGNYLFMQWRPEDLAALLGGIEWFARESWWEGTPGEGPYLIRRLREDGRLATQILRRLSAQ